MAPVLPCLCGVDVRFDGQARTGWAVTLTARDSVAMGLCNNEFNLQSAAEGEMHGVSGTCQSRLRFHSNFPINC